ncbi:MAG: oxidoreductase, partial [Mesorhizobium sp.]
MDKPVTSYDFPDRLRASLIDQNHPVYEEARGLYNAMIDKRPRWIIPCAEVADVVAAVNYAREKHLLLAIRGGGHN